MEAHVRDDDIPWRAQSRLSSFYVVGIQGRNVAQGVAVGEGRRYSIRDIWQCCNLGVLVGDTYSEHLCRGGGEAVGVQSAGVAGRCVGRQKY